MPPRRAVELRVGGQTYRVVGTEDDQHVQRLAELVDRKYVEVVPQGRGVTAQQAIFLTAMALAQEVEEQRSRAERLEAERDRSLHLATRARDVVSRLLTRVDGALSSAPSGASLPPGADSKPSTPTPLDAIDQPPDALHEPVMIDLLPPPSRDPDSVAAVQRAARAGLRLVREAGASSRDEGAASSRSGYAPRTAQTGPRPLSPDSAQSSSDDDSR